MIHPSATDERKQLKLAFAHPRTGILGLVDELLATSIRQDIRIDWRAGRCLVCLSGDGPLRTIDVDMPKSVFRAALARIAALCNERNPNSVSPYGGQGEVTLDADPARSV